MQSPGQLLFAREIPLFSRLADNSTFTPVEEVSIGLYRFNWSEVNTGHFLSDVAFFALGFLLLSLAMSYGKHYVRRDIASILFRAGRVLGALWCGVAAICLVVGAMDLGRLPIERAVAAFWTVALTIAGVALFSLCLMGLKRAAPDGTARRKSEIVIKVSGLVIAVSCASLLHVVDFPPQTALGWVVVQLLILGVPAGVGFLLPNRDEVETPEREPKRELIGARYFGAWDLALFVPLGCMLIIGRWIIPELSLSNVMPLVQALILSICLFNRVPKSEIKEHPKSLFGNVLSAWIFLQIVMPLGMMVSFSLPEPLPFTAYIDNYLSLGFAALVVALILSLRVLRRGERLERPWWKKARYWVVAGIVGVITFEIYPGLIFFYSDADFTISLSSVVIAAILAFVAFFSRRFELRRFIRFNLVGTALILSLVAFALSRMPKYATMVSMLQSVFPQRGIVILALLLLLIPLTLKKQAKALASALRGQPARVAVYSLVIALAFMFRSVENSPSYALGSMYYSSAGLTEDEQRALKNIILPESLAALRFLQQSTFDDLEGNEDSAIYIWAGIFPAPAKFPRLWEYVPRLMGDPSQFVVGAAKVTKADKLSDTRLDVLYSRRVTGAGLADHIGLQLRPNQFRRRAELALTDLRRLENWRPYLSYPRAIMEIGALCRSWNSLIEAVVDMAIFALSNPPGHEALKQLWRIDELPNVTIQ